MAVDLARLKSQLLTSGLSEKNQALFQIIGQLIDAVASSTGGGSVGPPGPPGPGSSPGGVSGDYQYNNAGAFAGGELKRPSVDTVEQKRGTNPQEYHFYNTESGGGLNYERMRFTTAFGDVFGEPCFTIQGQQLGTGTQRGISLRADSPGNISFQIPGNFPQMILYHDPTLAGGISLIPNGAGFVGLIFGDASGVLEVSTGGFGGNWMLDTSPGAPRGLIIGNTEVAGDFTNRMMTFDSTNVPALLHRVVIGLGAITGTGIGVGFCFDSSTANTVANLPATPGKSEVLWVNDALAPQIGSAVVGGGAAFAAVMWDGAAWKVFASNAASGIPFESTGTWTPTDASGAGLVLTASGTWVRHGSLVAASFSIVFPATASGLAVTIGSLPFTVIAGANAWPGIFAFTTVGASHTMVGLNGTTTAGIFTNAGGAVANSVYSGKTITGVVFFRV